MDHMASPKYSAKYHLDKCLKEDDDYSVGKSHCKLASLYDDFDQTSADVTEVQFNVKWKKASEAASALERLQMENKGLGQIMDALNKKKKNFIQRIKGFLRIRRFHINTPASAIKSNMRKFRENPNSIKSHPPDEVWQLIHKFFLKASTSLSCIEKDIFIQLMPEAYDSVVGGLSKRFDADESLKTKLLLFALENSAEDKQSKLVNRAITFLTERANIDKDVVCGVGKFHLILAVIALKCMIKRNFSQLPAGRILSIILTSILVSVGWSKHREKWIEKLVNVSTLYLADANQFAATCWTSVAGLIDRYIQVYEFGSAVNLQANKKLTTACIEKASSLKTEGKKIILLYIVWRAYNIWKTTNEGNILVWVPEDNWSNEVHKVIVTDGSPDKPAAKRARLSKDRRDVISMPSVSSMKATNPELCDAYEICSVAICTLFPHGNILESEETLRFAKNFPDIYQFISEAFLFECRFSEAVDVLKERLSNDPDDVLSRQIIHFQLACSNILERNWEEAMENAISVLYLLNFKALEKDFSDESTFSSQLATRSEYRMMNACEIPRVIFDIVHHILFKVYTSTPLSHDNDRILGSMLVLTQVNFATVGYRCFNRIVQYIEAKGSFIYPGLITYLTNIAIIEELSRIQEYCSEYVSVQIASPQGNRRIGQSTRYSVKGTKDFQKQVLDDQVKKCNDDQVQTVCTYFRDLKDDIIKMVESR